MFQRLPLPVWVLPKMCKYLNKMGVMKRSANKADTIPAMASMPQLRTWMALETVKPAKVTEIIAVDITMARPSVRKVCLMAML